MLFQWTKFIGLRSVLVRDFRSRLFFSSKEIRRKSVVAFFHNSFLRDRHGPNQRYLYDSAPFRSRLKNRCFYNATARATVSYFRLSRFRIRHFLLSKSIPGMRRTGF